ncbi:MAG: hypothetical protein RL701_2433, partial [Pseudomonadota bacterium]
MMVPTAGSSSQSRIGKSADTSKGQSSRVSFHGCRASTEPFDF